MTRKTSVQLFKENFKFSAAHFMIFDSLRAERLHGHNYQVSLDMQWKSETGESGYVVEFSELKSLVKALVDEWDEAVLLPQLHPEVELLPADDHIEVQFRERQYRFPRAEVRELAVVNTSVEELSKLFAEKLWSRLPSLQMLSVTISETAGQSATTELRSS